MNDLSAKNETRSTTKGSYQDHRLDKSNELSESMTINEGSRDEYENKLHNIGGASTNG